MGSKVSRSNQDFTVTARRHGNKQTQNTYSISQKRVRQNLSVKIRNISRLKTQLSPDQQDHLKSQPCPIKDHIKPQTWSQAGS